MSVKKLSEHYDLLVKDEQHQLELLGLHQPVNVEKRQRDIDRAVSEVLKLPELIEPRVTDFVKYMVRLSEKPNDLAFFTTPPSSALLAKYSKALVAALDGFAEGECFHKVAIRRSKDLVRCMVTIIKDEPQKPVQVELLQESDHAEISKLKELLHKKVSPRIYLQRNLRIYSENVVRTFKPAREIDWAESQAYADSNQIISEILTGEDPSC